MADEQAQAEVDTAGQQTKQQTSEETSNGSEAEQTTETENTGVETDDDKGDLRVPLKEERQKRQELEARLNDPNFVYERAKALGLTQEEAQAAVDAQQTVPQIPINILDAHYDSRRAREKAQERYPSLLKDKVDQVSVSAIAMEEGISLDKAADKYFAKMGKVKEEAKTEGIQQAQTEASTKEKAQTVSSGSTPSEDADLVQLRKDAASYDKHISDRAQIELLKIKNKKLGI
jgi:hypothetical protein